MLFRSVAAKEDRLGGRIREREPARVLSQLGDARVGLGRRQRRPAVRIRRHHQSEILNRRRRQLAGESADMCGAEPRPLPVMMRQVVHDDRCHRGIKVERRPDPTEKRSRDWAAGRFVAEVITRLAEVADVGVNLLDLDAEAHRMIRERGAESCYIDYHPSFGASPFGKVLCTSVNDAVLHGLPHDYRLRDGDLLSVDFAASVDGWVSDSALSVVVGTPQIGRAHV